MRLRDQRGFLLLEVIVAVSLIAVGLFVLLEGLGRCLAAARSVQNYSLVETLLANKSYEFRVERAQDFLDQDGKFDDYPGFEWDRRFDGTDAEGLWKQTITVYWTERSKRVSDSVVEFRYLPNKQR